MNEIKEKDGLVKQEKNTLLTVVDELKSTTVNNEGKSNKFKKAVKFVWENIFQTRVFVLLTAIAILLKTILLYKTVIFNNQPLEFKYIYMATAFIGIIVALPMLAKDKLRFWLCIFVNLLTSILLLMNEVYYGYATNLVSISQISNLQYGREISAALPSLLHIRHILYFIDIIIVLTLFFTKKIKIKKQRKTAYIFGVVYLIFIIILINVSVKDWIADAEEHQFNKVQQIEKTSVFGYHFIDIKNNVNMKKNVKYKTKESMLEDYNKLMEEYEIRYGSNLNSFYGIAKDKNVIIVQLESVQNFVVNKTINGKEITPNFNKFINENIEFTNMQNQSYSSTADAEFTVMNSIYPLENGMCFAQYPLNNYNNIYSNFKKEDYITTYIHGNEGSFWNRQNVYSRLPIANLLFDDIFEENVERVNKYVSDEQVYRRIVDEIKNCDGKFMVSIVASSSHIAFDMPGLENRDEKINIDVGDEYRGTLFGNYLEAMNYADYAFGVFVEELKSAGLYDDSVILIFGDHAGMQMYNEEMIDYINKFQPFNDIQTQINYSNVLCALKIPGVDHIQITKPTSRLDIKPTLMQICGIEDEFSLGQSMFSSKDFVCINTGRIITDKYFYNIDWYLIETGEQINVQQLPQEEQDKLNFYVECMQKELDISLSINILNLLK